MNSREHILERLRTIKPALQREFPLHRMALFGSWVRNEPTETSDVDILVDVDPSIGLRFVTLAERLETLLEQHVDLVSSRAVKPALLRQIQAELIDV
ncbi:MAG TPA: nucleotidyltransferase family protein [Pyrinomonadaceae bacterium]|nr:nucleotidyltransferase family protein [Pyrinomonadaceae bacterium]